MNWEYLRYVYLHDFDHDQLSDGEIAVLATSSDTHEQVMEEIELAVKPATYIYLFGGDAVYPPELMESDEDEVFTVSFLARVCRFLFPAIYCLDKVAHKLGYCPPTDNRFWWCEYAEDRLFEIAGIAHDNDGCFWCRRYYRRATWDDGE